MLLCSAALAIEPLEWVHAMFPDTVVRPVACDRELAGVESEAEWTKYQAQFLIACFTLDGLTPEQVGALVVERYRLLGFEVAPPSTEPWESLDSGGGDGTFFTDDMTGYLLLRYDGEQLTFAWTAIEE